MGRSTAENFREPDEQVGFLQFIPGDWLTMGMLLSLPMWIGGAWLVWQAVRQRGAHPA